MAPRDMPPVQKRSMMLAAGSTWSKGIGCLRSGMARGGRIRKEHSNHRYSHNLHLSASLSHYLQHISALRTHFLNT